MGTIRCKMYCVSVTKRSARGWYTNPPSEYLFSAINGDRFEPGKEYYIDLSLATPAEAPAQQ